MKTILVYPTDSQWSTAAVHLASAIARTTGAQVGLLALATVPNPALLGSDLGYAALDAKTAARFDTYAEIAEDYGVPVTIYRMQCLTLTEALAQAVEVTGAHILFAQIPAHTVPVLRRVYAWYLRRLLQNQHCELYTVDKPQDEPALVPSVMVKHSV
jgi:hypothetical protein